MINKSVFEEELIAGMHKELVKNATNQDSDNVGEAVDYLNSAIDIFEDAGMKAQADKVLRILAKIATSNRSVMLNMPTFKSLIEAGMHPQDPKEVSTNPIAKARINKAYRALGYSDKEMGNFIGHHNVMDPKDVAELTDENRSFSKMWDWMQDPLLTPSSSNLKPGDEFNISSVASDENDAKKKQDRHTKGLTSEKMVANLKHHGTVFNLSDDGNAADDMLDLDVNDADLEVSEKDADLEDFEDERN
jgi:hypothetical protein